MSSVPEIEQALRQLPLHERLEVARWLLEYLQDHTPVQLLDSGENGAQALSLPDYSARRRRIFGSKILPNMVLATRAEERW